MEHWLSGAFGSLVAAETLPPAATVLAFPDALLPALAPFLSRPGAVRHFVADQALFFDRAGGAATMLDGAALEATLDGTGVRFRLAPGAGWPALELSAASRNPIRLRKKWQLIYQIDAARAVR